MIPTDPNPDHSRAQGAVPAHAAGQMPELVTAGGDPGSRGRDALKIDENAPLLSDTRHPDHQLYRQAAEELRKLDPAQMGFKDEREFMNAAAVLAQKAKAGGLHDINHVVASTSSAGIFAVQGGLDDERRNRVYVDNDQARVQPFDQTSYQMQQEAHLQQQRGQQDQLAQQQVAQQQHERETRGPYIG